MKSNFSLHSFECCAILWRKPVIVYFRLLSTQNPVVQQPFCLFGQVFRNGSEQPFHLEKQFEMWIYCLYLSLICYWSLYKKFYYLRGFAKLRFFTQTRTSVRKTRVSRGMSCEESYLAIIRYLTDEREPYAPGTPGNTKRKIRKAAACYVVRNGTLFYQRRLKGQNDFTELEVVLQDGRRKELINDAHIMAEGEHFNQQLTWEIISQKYWWRGRTLY